ncbi:MAG: cyclase family protein [Rhodospirillales bacterium]|nr:cyclase family protein [Rhodospirillales bacterium]MDH3790738.1 cyclase family protein [Rhodospirillales bacterium]MDH3910992.1 cyclase family protein [Rhodospirillales bacterium]MDH3920866.1 cyclase family protein [Rhodospirillales bacterium]MDH3965700.1 cyclase family protein [Rhodospirillales bacterium]
MSRIIDLTLPIEEHFRWGVERRLTADLTKGDRFQVTWLGLPVHAFTHIDAPRHMVPEGSTTSEVGLERVVGEAAVVDLSGLAPDTAVGPDMLEEKGAHVGAGDIVLLKTCWDRVCSHHTPEFWTTAPYMTREACTWLLEKGIKALGVDFPQDYPIRGLLNGETAPISEFVTHDVLLRCGVILIEYLCNLAALETERTMLFALPLKLPEADGAPARVIAWEPD